MPIECNVNIIKAILSRESKTTADRDWEVAWRRHGDRHSM